MDPIRYRQFLKNNIPSAKDASGNTEIVCRCFSCPDSRDPNSGHFYIHIPQTEDDLSFCHCFKCGYASIVTYQKLLEWSIFDSDMALELTAHNNKVFSNPINSIKFGTQDIYRLTNSHTTQDGVSEVKLKYINNRLGLNLNYSDLIENKIVLNLNDILVSNNIKEFTRHQNIITQLDSSFMGFISFDNAFVNMRNLTSGGKVYEKIDKRFINYSIFGKRDNTCKFYLIPCNLDITSPEPIKIHISEGPFDALSIKYNLRKETRQTIYTAVTGNGYKGLIRYIITTLKLMNLEIHLYVDSDVSRWKILDLAEFLSVYNYPLYLHRNTIGKDMGVRLDQINESIERLV